MDDQQRPSTEELLALIEQQRRDYEQQIGELRQQIARPRKRSRYAFRRLMIPAVTGLAALSMSGSAYAAIPDPSSVIHGCYSTLGTDHALFLVDSALTPVCPTGQTPISWNAHGPTGPTGATGPVVGYEAHSPKGAGTLLAATPAIIAHTPSLPAGTYLVDSSAFLNVDGGNDGVCYIGTQNSTSAPPDGIYGESGNPTVATDATVGTTDSVTVSANGQITLWCYSRKPKDAIVYDGSLTAVPVTSITTGSPS